MLSFVGNWKSDTRATRPTLATSNRTCDEEDYVPEVRETRADLHIHNQHGVSTEYVKISSIQPMEATFTRSSGRYNSLHVD
jgi:hypothetical protein